MKKGRWLFQLLSHYHIFRKDRDTGKAGGIAWLVHQKYLHITKQLDIDIKGASALQILNGSRKLFLVGVDFPPSGTLSREALLERNDIVDRMPGLLKKLSDLGEVVLLGDTNACVGNLSDSKVIFDEPMDEDLERTLVTKWREPNYDSIGNGNGDEIISWARAGGLWILNGRCLPKLRT